MSRNASKGKKRNRSKGPCSVYILKVSLVDDPDIWRRIGIRGDQTLHDFHLAIFRAFDRYDEHLYCFYIPPPGRRGKKALAVADQYLHPRCRIDYLLPWLRPRNAGNATIGELGLQPGQFLYYEFDFGDEWRHEIELEQITQASDSQSYPRVLARHGKSPPQYPYVEEESWIVREEDVEFEDEPE